MSPPNPNDPAIFLLNLLIGIIAVPIFTWLLNISPVNLHPQWFAFGLSLLISIIVAVMQGVPLWPPDALLTNMTILAGWSQICYRALATIFPKKPDQPPQALTSPPPPR